MVCNNNEVRPDDMTWRVIVAILLKKSGGQVTISNKEAAAVLDGQITVAHLPDGMVVRLED